jgi:ribonuclease Z
MPKLIFLGTANAVPDDYHENTHMAIVGKERLMLIDCVDKPVVRLRQAGLEFQDLTDVILTHFHPDHVSGVPTLLMQSWLLGRRNLLNIYGLAYTLDRVEKWLDFYEWGTWPNFFPVNFHRLPEKEMTPVLTSREICVYASPVRHLVPTIGIRIEFPLAKKAVAYSCDTEPCDEVVRLAKDVDALIHEATGVMQGHSSAAQAGEIAKKAMAKELYLIHYRTLNQEPGQLVQDAMQTYQGQVTLAQELTSLEF